MSIRDALLQELRPKLEPSVERLCRRTGDDHDVFPALLWALLDSDAALGRQVSETESRLTAEFSGKLDAAAASIHEATEENRNSHRDVHRAVAASLQAAAKENRKQLARVHRLCTAMLTLQLVSTLALAAILLLWVR